MIVEDDTYNVIMAKKNKKKKHKKRNLIALGMILAKNKPTKMKKKTDYNRREEKNVDELDVFEFKRHVAKSLPWSEP